MIDKSVFDNVGEIDQTMYEVEDVNGYVINIVSELIDNLDYRSFLADIVMRDLKDEKRLEDWKKWFRGTK